MCACTGLSSGPCKSIGGDDTCYEKNVLGNCPAGTYLCESPTLEALDVEVAQGDEVALLSLELAQVTMDVANATSALMEALADIIGDGARIDVINVAALEGADDAIVIGVLVSGVEDATATATAISEDVASGSLSTAVGGGMAVTQVLGQVKSAPPAPDNIATEGDAPSGQADNSPGEAPSDAPGNSSSTLFWVAVVAAGVIVAVGATVFVSRRRRSSVTMVTPVTLAKGAPTSHLSAKVAPKRPQTRVQGWQ